jgi:hypothetical protein
LTDPFLWVPREFDLPVCKTIWYSTKMKNNFNLINVADFRLGAGSTFGASGW